MRSLVAGIAAVLGLLALAAAGFLAVNVPAGVRLGLTMWLAPGCTPPDVAPANAGRLVVADLRAGGAGDAFGAASVAEWSGQVRATLRENSDPGRDLVVYVHGFNTSLATARCAGKTLSAELAALSAYAAGKGPDVLVFGWPGEVLPWRFATAEANAARAAPYLAGVLEGAGGRRVFLVAHSLGARVALEAAGALANPGGRPPLAGILLVEGAIPAVSVRTWRSVFTLTHPMADLDDVRNGRPVPPPHVEVTQGTGSLVAAATRAAHLVVTVAGRDVALNSFFRLSNGLQPFDGNRPVILPEIADPARNGIGNQAIGSPFPEGGVYRSADLTLGAGRAPRGLDLRPDAGVSEPGFPAIGLPDPSIILDHSEWRYDFAVPHPSYHEIRLDAGEGWRLIFDWHGALNDPAKRHAILSGAWAVFDSGAD